MYELQTTVVACVAVAIAIYAVRWYNDPIHAIPTVGGPSLPGLSYLGALRALRNSKEILEEGYRKYPEGAFKVANFDRWVVVVSGRGMVEDLRKRPVDELSGARGFQETFQSKYILEPAVLTDRYHAEIAAEKLLKQFSGFLPDAIDEVIVAAKDTLPAGDDEWTSVEVTHAMRRLFARASNRTFFGLPLCRNEEYLGLVISCAQRLSKDTGALHMVPEFLKGFAAPFVMAKMRAGISRTVSHTRPIIEERTRAFTEFGEAWDHKPNDLLQAMLEKAIPRGETASAITQRFFIFNFASINTSSIVINNALYHLAENPDLVAALREEVQACVAAVGWTAPALGNMKKLDSLLRETARYYGIGPLTMARLALKDVTLHDGTRLPAGTLVAVNVYPFHHDTAILADADTFDPFRYARMRRVAGHSLRHQFTSTSPEYIPFGHGPRACPGRFFASNVLKAALACILVKYDLKLAGDGTRPPNVGRILFKRRGSGGPV